jgi:hypothetical protein
VANSTVRDPRQHPDAIIPDLATNNVYKFSKDQVAFVYGSIWKQRYFTKVGDDYFPLPVQWEVVNKKWATGGLLSIPATICIDRRARFAMAAIRSATIFTQGKWPSGTSAANAATAPEATTLHIPHAATSLIRHTWITSPLAIVAFSAIRKDSHFQTQSKASIAIGLLAITGD